MVSNFSVNFFYSVPEVYSTYLENFVMKILEKWVKFTSVFTFQTYTDSRIFSSKAATVYVRATCIEA